MCRIRSDCAAPGRSHPPRHTDEATRPTGGSDSPSDLQRRLRYPAEDREADLQRKARWIVRPERSRSETPPTDQSYAVYDELAAQIDAQLQRLAQIVKTDVPGFNQMVKDQNVPAVVVKPPGESR